MVHELASQADHEKKRSEAIRQFGTLFSTGQNISIKKNVKHIFKNGRDKPNLDLRHFDQVLSIDTDNNVATVEGMTSFYNLVEATLAFDLMPQAVPELRSITVGGAIAGLGGQSSSFKFGLVHEMVTDFDLLTGEGKVIHCSPESNSDIFFMLPNSYGSLGYILSCNFKLNPVSPYVRVQCLRFDTADAFFKAIIREVESSEADFLEGASFSSSEHVLLKGTFTGSLSPAEQPSVPLHEPFFKRIRDPGVDSIYLTIKDYIWRWDPDAFWATDQKNIIGSVLLNPLFRKTLGPYLLRSDRLLRMGKLRNRLRKNGLARYVLLESRRKESIIQDAAIPISAAAEFGHWLAKNLQIYPIWYCPVRSTKPPATYPLYDPGSEFVLDFGFYVSMELEDDMEATYYNRQIEKKLLEIGGLKCLYSDTFFPKDQFWSIYDKAQYDRVKAKYDPDNTFLDLYQKVANEAK